MTMQDRERIDQIKTTFEELDRGLQELEKDAAGGDLKSIKDGLPELRAAISELKTAVLELLCDGNP